MRGDRAEDCIGNQAGGCARDYAVYGLSKRLSTRRAPFRALDESAVRNGADSRLALGSGGPHSALSAAWQFITRTNSGASKMN